MIFTALIVLYFPTAVFCGTCQCSNGRLECSGINQDEFINQVFKWRNCLERNSVSINISNSNFETIEEFPNLKQLLIHADVNKLVIQNSSIKHIHDGAFLGLDNLYSIDLSENKLNNFTFIKSLPYSVHELILHDNDFEEIDLNFIQRRGDPHDARMNVNKLDLSKNKISSILSRNKILYLNFIDLSYNNLTQLNETELQSDFKSLNLSYNFLTNIEVQTSKNIITLIGNNIKSINSDKTFLANTVYLDFIPKNVLYIKSLFSLSNTMLGFLNAEIPLNVKSLSYVNGFDINLSNTSLSNISPNYFQNLNIFELKLSHNNFGILNESLFLNTYLRKFDLSNSKISSITSEVFTGLSNNYFSILILHSNLLEEFENVCQSLSAIGTLDLSSNRFKKIDSHTFDNCTSLRLLNISNSLISSVQFSSPSVKVLDLSRNYLTEIGSNDFRSSKLKEIILKNNKISSIESNAFANLKYLESIDLSNNVIQTIGEYGFSNLASVREINLSNNNNKLRILESNVFKNLSVPYINLQGNDIRYIKSKAFNGLYNLRLLNFSGTGLTTLEKEAFFNLPKIDTIDLTNNNLIIIDNSSFKNLPINNLLLYGNSLKEIKSEAFQNLNNLKYLNLSNFKINKLEPNAFSNLPNLELIDLRNNNFTSIQSTVFKKLIVKNMYFNGINQSFHLDNTVIVTNISLQFSGTLTQKTISNSYLKYLYILDSRIDFMKNNCLLGNYGLEELHFINSNVSELEQGAFRGLFSLKHLIGTSIFRKIRILPTNFFQDLNKLQILKLSDSELSEIEDGAFFGLFSLQELYLNRNKMSFINAKIFAPLNYSLRVLDLSENSFNIIDLAEIGNRLPNLKSLNISSALITELESHSSNSKSNSIEELYLADNYIEAINKTTFNSFVNLKILFLNRNKLETIPHDSFYYLRKLENLRLDGNQLTLLPFEIFDGIENLKYFNISFNKNLFNQFRTNNIKIFTFFKQLNYLNLDSTGLGDSFAYHNLKYLNLKSISINTNSFSCNFLLDLLIYLKDNHINYIPNNAVYFGPNIKGIPCNI